MPLKSEISGFHTLALSGGALSGGALSGGALSGGALSGGARSGGARSGGQAWHPAPGRQSSLGHSSSVRREARVYLLDPGQHAAANVHGVREAGVLHDRQALGAAHTALAVQHDALVLRQLL